LILHLAFSEAVSCKVVRFNVVRSKG
jgi:hypothetical protein